MASTSSANLTPTAQGYFKPIHRESTDIGWQWSSYKDESKKKIVCDFCEHSTPGITRAKEHQLGIQGHVKPCTKTPEYVKDRLKCDFARKQAAKDAASGLAKELQMQTPASALAPNSTKERKKRGRPSQDELRSLAELSPMPVSFAIPATGEFSATERGRGFYDLTC